MTAVHDSSVDPPIASASSILSQRSAPVAKPAGVKAASTGGASRLRT